MTVDIKVPNVGESVQEGMIASWHKKDGEWIDRDEVLLELETDKATVEVVAESAGVLAILAPAGKVVKVGEKIGTIATDGQKKSASAAPAAEKPKPVVKEVAPAAAKEQPRSLEPGPAVRRMVEEHQVDLQQIKGSGKGGRPTKGDVITHLAAPVGSQSKEKTRREPMSMLRRRIAERLLESQRTAATLTTFNEVDMSAIIELRKKYQDKFQEKYGIKLGFMGFFLKACVAALQEFPRVNASIEGNDIVYHDYCAIGVAVSTEKGLMVPVIRNVEQLTLAEVELEIAAVAKKGRDNKISLEDLSGGTFTVSNGGVFGSLLSTPILNPPQSGILGMHKTELRPVVGPDNSVVVRPMMYVALSYDHRMIDGKESVSFLVAVKNALEDPSRLLLGV
jgi:2-oxoglutarate dehydrogenase E2 component (dihydrolipoamide succinyltransferase)